MTQSITKKWGLLSWRLLFVCGLLLLQEWAFAALVKPSFMGGTPRESSHLSLAISFKQPQTKHVEGTFVAEKTVAVVPSENITSRVPEREVVSVSPVSPTLDTGVGKPAVTHKINTLSANMPKPKFKRSSPSKSTLANQEKSKVNPHELEHSYEGPKTVLVDNSPSSVQTKLLADLNTKAPESIKDSANQINVSESIVTKPIFAAQPKPPRYPKVARKRGQEGTVWLDIWLDEKGNKSKLEITQSSGLTLLDQSALKAVSGWKFKPSEKNGIRFASRVRIPIVFSLN